MRLLRKLAYISFTIIIISSFVGCPVVEPDDTVKITELQTVIDKASSGATITLSDYGDITDYNATIDKSVKIVGTADRTDLKGATLTINAGGVFVGQVKNVDIIISSSVGTGSCTISDSEINNLTSAGCELDGSLILDSTTVTNGEFVYDDETPTTMYLGLTMRNISAVENLSSNTYLAVFDEDGSNAIYTLNIAGESEESSCVAVLSSMTISNKSREAATVHFYDSTLSALDMQANIDCIVYKNRTDSIVTKPFFIKACEFLLGNAVKANISSDCFGVKISGDVSSDIQNMVETVTAKFVDNTPSDASTDRKLIKNGKYRLSNVSFSWDNHVLYGWATDKNATKPQYDADGILTVSDDVTLYAIWETIYNIRYMDKDISGDVTFDSWADGYTPITKYGTYESVTLPDINNVTKSGYYFKGWYRNSAYTGGCVTGWSADSSIYNSDVTLYAKWEYSVSMQSVLARSGNGTMTLKWTAPNDPNVAKVSVIFNGTAYDITSDAGAKGSKTFSGLTNGQEYSFQINASDKIGNKTDTKTVNNYCGTYIDSDGSLIIKGTKYDNTVMKTIADRTTDIVGSGSDGVFVSGRTVTLSPYSLCKYEVTQKLFSDLMGYNPSSTTGDDLPVNMVNRTSCMSMCSMLNEVFGYENPSDDDVTVDVSKEGFRLPTEAEWEFAARGADPSSDIWSYTYSGNNSVSEVAWYSANSNKTIHTVGTKSPNALGIYDMSGNVCEWIADTWLETIPSGAVTAPVYNSGNEFVQRGGGYGSIENFCTVTVRTSEIRSSASKYCGFRLAISGVTE